MEAIIPRWEWRAFAASFGEADRRFRELAPGRVQESGELYLLSPSCDANVKIRDGLMDIKTLEQVDEHGLQQWRPALKAAFPLSAADVTRVSDALEVAPLPRRATWALGALQAELAHPSRNVRAVAIHKQRQRYSIGGCLAELTGLVAEDRTTRSVALELEDPAQVWAAVLELGLEPFENTSYPRGLKCLLGWPA
jgi:exopolyphosphatase/guanosine-5'-triphosphate,3'-diphosphate pyrophosphatase